MWKYNYKSNIEACIFATAKYCNEIIYNKSYVYITKENSKYLNATKKRIIIRNEI